MSLLARATAVLPGGTWRDAEDHVALDYEGRFVRRKRLVAASGASFLVDLPEVVNLLAGEAFALQDGRRIEVRCAPEPVLDVQGDLARLAWHIGNRHTPCQIEAARLVIRDDHVLEAMLRAQVLPAELIRGGGTGGLSAQRSPSPARISVLRSGRNE